MDLVIDKLAFVVTLVYKFQDTLPSLGAILILALIHFSIWPLFHSVTILLIILPFPHILRSIIMCVGTLPIRLVIQPLPLIHVPVCVIECPLTIRLVVFPLSDVF